MKACKVYLTDEQKEIAKTYAEKRGLKLGVFIRYAMLQYIRRYTK